MRKKIIASFLAVTSFVSFSGINVYADDEITTENVILEENADATVEESPYLPYEQTKQIIVQNAFNESVERLEYCKDLNITTDVTEKINEELTKNLIIDNVSLAVGTSADTLTEELSDLTEKKQLKEPEAGDILYDSFSADYDEEFLLAVIIFCEAGNQSYEGKIAVGNVVLNRVVSPRFKQNTIEDVIRAPGQFQPVGMGWYDRELRKGTVNESCLQAARDALNGVNIVGDCLFFHRTHGNDPGIILGDHVFY